jgi:hypothetical protein
MQPSQVAEDTGPGCGWPSERGGDGGVTDASEWEACVVVWMEMGLLAWVMVWRW